MPNHHLIDTAADELEAADAAGRHPLAGAAVHMADELDGSLQQIADDETIDPDVRELARAELDYRATRRRST